MIDFITAEEDIEAILRDETTCVISDSTYPTRGLVHPRVYGTYVRLFERTCARGVLSPEQAVRKVTACRRGCVFPARACLRRVWTQTSMCSRWKDFMRREPMETPAERAGYGAGFSCRGTCNSARRTDRQHLWEGVGTGEILTFITAGRKMDFRTLKCLKL